MNANLIPDLPFKFKSLEGYVWTVTESTVNRDGYGEYFAVRNEDGREAAIPSVKMKVNLKSGYWEIVKEDKLTAKEKLDNILNNEGQQVLDSLKEKYVNKAFTKADLKDGMVCTTRRGEKYIVKGDRMTNKDRGYMMLEDINDDLTVTGLDFLDIIYVHQQVFNRTDQKQLAIQKELEFAKAKAERLAAHISVLESKLK